MSIQPSALKRLLSKKMNENGASERAPVQALPDRNALDRRWVVCAQEKEHSDDEEDYGREDGTARSIWDVLSPVRDARKDHDDPQEHHDSTQKAEQASEFGCAMTLHMPEDHREAHVEDSRNLDHEGVLVLVQAAEVTTRDSPSLHICDREREAKDTPD